MKQSLSYVCAAAVSLLLCGVILLWPMGEGALWQRSCVNIYSAFAAAFFLMNTVGLWGAVSGRTLVGKKPYTEERPVIEAKKRHGTGAVLAFLEVPLLLTVFYVEGGLKMAACSALFVGGSLILAGLVGEWCASGLRRELREQEQRELEEQLKKERE